VEGSPPQLFLISSEPDGNPIQASWYHVAEDIAEFVEQLLELVLDLAKGKISIEEIFGFTFVFDRFDIIEELSTFAEEKVENFKSNIIDRLGRSGNYDDDSLEALKADDLNDWVNISDYDYLKYRKSKFALKYTEYELDPKHFDSFIELMDFFDQFSIKEVMPVVKYHCIANDGLKDLRAGDYEKSLASFQQCANILESELSDHIEILLEGRNDQIHNYLYKFQTLDVQIFDEGTLVDYIGLCYRFKNRYGESVSNHVLAQQLRLKASNYDRYLTELNIGNYYYFLKDYKLAKKYYIESLNYLDLESGSKIEETAISIYVNLSRTYIKLIDFKNSKRNAEIALEMALETRNDYLLGLTYETLSKCLLYEGDNIGSFHILQKSYSKYLLAKRWGELSYVLLLLTTFNLQEENHQSIVSKINQSQFISRDESESTRRKYKIAKIFFEVHVKNSVNISNASYIIESLKSGSLQPEVNSIAFIFLVKLLVKILEEREPPEVILDEYIFISNQISNNFIKHNSTIIQVIGLITSYLISIIQSLDLISLREKIRIQLTQIRNYDITKFNQIIEPNKTLQEILEILNPMIDILFWGKEFELLEII